MSDAETQLLALLKERSFKEGDFSLASGDRSNYYIDGKMTQVFSAGAHLIGQVLYERTKDLQFDAIGGLAAGAIPPTTSAVIAYHRHGRSMEGFWVREEVKRHGTQKEIEGNVRAGSRVVILDDVITKGNSVIKAVAAVRKIGCEIVQVIALVDRMVGARQLFEQHGIREYSPVFEITQFGVKPEARGQTQMASH
jgi:orotate phosphoribosyltransferase